MTSQLIAANRENAEIVTGAEACKRKAKELMKKMSLPVGMIPLPEVEEIGYNPTTGFIWTIKKKKVENLFKGINKKSTFDTEVTAFLEERRIKKITGVKSKELMLWVSITDIRIDDPASGKIIFTTTTGITKTFPISAFEEEEEEEEVKKVEVKEKGVEVKKVEEVKNVDEVKKVDAVAKEVEVKN